MTIVEFVHGIYRAKAETQRKGRRDFVEELIRDVALYPVTLEIARLAGQLEGQGAGSGMNIAFEDLLIGATALHLGFGVATSNVRHFKLIQGLAVVQF